MAIIGTKEGSRKSYKSGQPGIANYRHEDAWYEDLGEMALEFGLKSLAAIGGFAAGGPMGAMAAVGATGYMTKAMTGGEEVIPADVSANLAYLVSTGYEKMQTDSGKGMMGDTEEDRQKAKYAGAPDVPSDIPKGNFIYKDGQWVEADAGSQAARPAMAIGAPQEPTPVYAPQQRSVAAPLTTSTANIAGQAAMPAVAAMGGAGGLVAGPAARIATQQAFSAPTAQLDMEADQATAEFMSALKGVVGGAASTRTKTRPVGTTVYQ